MTRLQSRNGCRQQVHLCGVRDDSVLRILPGHWPSAEERILAMQAVRCCFRGRKHKSSINAAWLLCMAL